MSEAPHRAREIWLTGRASVTRSADGRLSRSAPSLPKPPESLAPSTSRGNRHRSSTEPLADDASADARPADVGRGCTRGRGDWPMRLMRHRLACRCYSTWHLPCGRMHNRPCSNINCGSGPTISRPRHRMSMSRVFGSGTSIALVRFSHIRSAAMARAGRDSSVQHRMVSNASEKSRSVGDGGEYRRAGLAGPTREESAYQLRDASNDSRHHSDRPVRLGNGRRSTRKSGPMTTMDVRSCPPALGRHHL